MIKILLIDESSLIAEVMASVLNAEEDMQVASYIAGVQEVREALREYPCDVVLISSTLPKSDAFEVIHVVKDVASEIKIIVIGMPDSRDHIIAFIECGVDGYVLREDSTDMLFECIREVFAGNNGLSNDLVPELVERVRELSTFCRDMLSDLDAVDLTDRELDVLKRLAQKKSNADIAEDLCIEVGTVKSHVHKILQKLNVDNRKEAAKYYPLVLNAAEPLSSEQDT